MKQVVKSTLLTLLLLVPASALAQSDVGVYVTAPDLQTKEIDFKVVEGQNVKSGFQVRPESVVQVAQGGNLLVVTEPRNNVDSVKITDGSGRITKLINTNGDTFSLSGITPGVYTLDVIVNQPNSNNRAAYETILVILQPGQAPQDPNQIIQKVRVITDVRITFEDDDNDDGCSDEAGSAGMPYPMDKRTECEKKFYDHCKRIGFGSSGRCENQYELFHDNDCFGFNNANECSDYFNDRDAFCLENPNHKKCPKPDPELPICGEGGYEPGELCRDDGDEDEIRCADGSIIIPSAGEECPPEEPIYPPPCPPSCPNDEDLPPVRNPGAIDPNDPDNPVPDIDEEVEEDVEEEDSEETEEESESDEGTDSEVN